MIHRHSTLQRLKRFRSSGFSLGSGLAEKESFQLLSFFCVIVPIRSTTGTGFYDRNGQYGIDQDSDFILFYSSTDSRTVALNPSGFAVVHANSGLGNHFSDEIQLDGHNQIVISHSEIQEGIYMCGLTGTKNDGHLQSSGPSVNPKGFI